MDRRELLKSCVAAVTGAAGLPVSVSALEDPATRPALVVLEFPGHLSLAAASRITDVWSQAIAGTPFEGVKAVVLDGGMTLTMLDAEGRPLNKSL